MKPWDALRGLRVFDLARPLEASTPNSPSNPPFRMALIRRHGDLVRADGASEANELMTLGGHTGTHVDGLAHVAVHGRLQNGADAVAAARGGRFAELGVETLPPAIGRGVLLDVAGLLGVPSLDPAFPITADLAERCAAEQSTTVGAGDAVLFRTGWPNGRYRDVAAYNGAGVGAPGPDESAARWLASHGVAITGSDTISFESIGPAGVQSVLPAHRVLIAEHGIPILEVLDLEEIAAASVREFLFVAIPLRIVGATGSPVRPLALA